MATKSEGSEKVVTVPNLFCGKPAGRRTKSADLMFPRSLRSKALRFRTTNSLRVGARGPTLLEDFHFREKIFHFDHERIPERVVHARGFGAHGYFENYESLARVTRADLFQRAEAREPRPSCDSRPLPATKARATWPATCAVSRSNCIRNKATGTSLGITSPSSLFRTRSSFRT